MAVKKIVSPASWINGTIVTPTFQGDVEDTLNSTLASSTTRRCFRDDFAFAIPSSPMVATGVLGNNWSVAVATNMSLAMTGNPGAISSGVLTGGSLSISNSTNSALSMSMSSFICNLLSTTNIYAAWRVRIPTLASLDTVANGGLVLDFGNFGFVAGNNSGFWNYQNFAGTRTATTASITNGQWYTLEFKREGGSCTWMVDGTSVATASSETSSGSTVALDVVVKSLAVTTAVMVNIDYAGVDLISAATG